MTKAKPLRFDHEGAEVFLSRVANLSPADWGRLDAAAARLKGGGLLTRWTRARRIGAAMGYEPWVRTITTPAAFMGEALFDMGFAVWSAYRTAESISDSRPARQRFEEALQRYQRKTQGMAARPTPAPTGVDALRMRTHFERLSTLAREQPGHLLGDAFDCLLAALFGVLMRPHLVADAFDELYSPVEPIIPAASLNALP